MLRQRDPASARRDVIMTRSSLLPMPRGATWARANAIGNDRVIVGESDVGGVMWTGAPGAFTVTLLKSIRPFDIDHGYGTVGDNGNAAVANALYGSPDSTGTFGWDASARAVTSYGVAAGVAYLFFNPWDAFVADHAGNITFLPVVQGVFPAGAFGINDCGALAGYVASSARQQRRRRHQQRRRADGSVATSNRSVARFDSSVPATHRCVAGMIRGTIASTRRALRTPRGTAPAATRAEQRISRISSGTTCTVQAAGPVSFDTRLTCNHAAAPCGA